jgi:hypothetical protein
MTDDTPNNIEVDNAPTPLSTTLMSDQFINREHMDVSNSMPTSTFTDDHQNEKSTSYDAAVISPFSLLSSQTVPSPTSDLSSTSTKFEASSNEEKTAPTSASSDEAHKESLLSSITSQISSHLPPSTSEEKDSNTQKSRPYIRITKNFDIIRSEEDERNAKVIKLQETAHEHAWKKIQQFEHMHRFRCPNPRLSRVEHLDHLSWTQRFNKRVFSAKPYSYQNWYINRCGEEVPYSLEFYNPPIHILSPFSTANETGRKRLEVPFVEVRPPFTASYWITSLRAFMHKASPPPGYD